MKIEADIHVHLDAGAPILAALFLAALTQTESKIMAKIEDVLASVQSLADAAVAEKAQVAAAIDGLKAQVTSLQEQQSAGGAISAADLDQVVAAIDSAKALVVNIQEDAPAVVA